jgi:hypothetical protein
MPTKPDLKPSGATGIVARSFIINDASFILCYLLVVSCWLFITEL